MRWAPDDPALLVERYQSGASTRQLGEEHGVSYATIARALRIAGCELRPPNTRVGRPSWTPADPADFIARYKRGATLSELAREQVVGENAVRAALVRLNVPLRAKTWDAPASFFQRYADGATYAELAEEFDIAVTTIRGALLRAGIERRAAHHRRWAPPEDLAGRYAAGASIQALASIEGVAQATIRKALLDQDIKLRRAKTRWRGPRDLATRYERGATIRKLSLELGVSTTTITAALHARGVRIRPSAAGSSSGPKFGAAIDEYVADQWAYGRFTSKATEVGYRRVLSLHADDVGNRDPALVGRDDVITTLKRWSDKPNTLVKRRSMLISFYRWMVEHGRRADNPAEQTPRPKTKKPEVYRLTRSEVVAMLDAAETLHERRIVMLGCLAGLRNQEIRGLRGAHFARSGFVHVSAEIAKGGRERWVPVLPELEPTVAEIVATVPIDHFALPRRSPRYFKGPGEQLPAEMDSTRPCSGQLVWRTVIELAKRAGIRAHIHPHLLRHAFGDHITRQVPLRHASEIMGHASSQTTEEHYLGRLSPEDLTTATRGLVLYGEAPAVRRVA